jgi:RimJ/RimL family protein N-acetyltransferase
MNTILRDELIELRPLTLDDAAEHIAGEDVEWENWLSGGPSTEESVVSAITRWMEEWSKGGPIRNFGVWEIARGRLVGNIELNLSGSLVGVGADEANLAYGIFAHSRRRGFAVRSVDLACGYLRAEEPWISSAVIRVEPENVASIAVALRAGFRADGEVPGDSGTPMLRFARNLLHGK